MNASLAKLWVADQFDPNSNHSNHDVIPNRRKAAVRNLLFVSATSSEFKLIHYRNYGGSGATDNRKRTIENPSLFEHFSARPSAC
jgi:hypothetical protein